MEAVLQRDALPEKLQGRALTRIERGTLRLVLEGKSNREIAGLLHRSIRTIETHRNRLMRKLGVDNVVALVRRAANLGLTESCRSK